MSTLAKAKKPVRAMKKPAKAKDYGFAISPVTGLPFKPLAPGRKPITREALKAALSEAL